MHSTKERKSKSVINLSLIDSLHLPSLFKPRLCPATRDCIQRETWCLGPCAGVYYYLTLCRLHKVHINLEYHSVCPLVRVGTRPLPLILASVPPLGTKGGSRAHLPAMEGRGSPNSNEWRKILALLSTLWSTPTHVPWAILCLDLELTLCQSRLYPPVRD
jgi:hypothetical protein